MGQVERYPNGTFCWVDLGTNDAVGAKRFYGGLFGWEFDDLPTGEQGTHSTCRLGGRAVAGLYDGAERPMWGSYISVEDVGRATERARELAAEVLAEPFETPGGGRVATVKDPAGAVVSLSQPGRASGPSWSTRTAPGPGTSWSAPTWPRAPGSTPSCSGGRPRSCPGRSHGRASPSGTC